MPCRKRERAMRRFVRTLAVPLVALGLLSGAAPLLGVAAGSAAPTTTPTRYVRQVCVALNKWDNTSDDDSHLIKALNASKKSPKSARQAIAALYALNVKVTDQLIAKTKAIGAPRLADGQQVVSDYLQTLGDFRDAYDTARDAVAHAPATSSTVLASAVWPIDSTLATQLASIGDPLTVLSTDSTLASAIQTDDGCGQVLDAWRVATSAGLKVGDCTSSHEEKVPCSEPHDSEVTLVTSYPASSTDPFPGNDAIQSFVDQNCAAAFASYVGVSFDQSSYTYGWWKPLAGGDWNGGNREVVCTVTNGDSTPMTGSVKEQAS
jgi:Septum formation